jgi:hypothetical protein
MDQEHNKIIIASFICYEERISLEGDSKCTSAVMTGSIYCPSIS